MTRAKSNTKKVRKNYDLPTKQVAFIHALKDMLGMSSEQEVIRYAISQCFYMESAVKEGCWLVIRDKEGKERAIIFK